MLHIHHINLQPIVGGGEVYTRSLTRAFAEAGARVTLYVHPRVDFWDAARGGEVSVVRVADEQALLAQLPRERACVLTQCPLAPATVTRLAGEHRLAGFAHMPMVERSADNFREYALVATVSRYCVGLLNGQGLRHVYPEPVYGSAEPMRGAGPIVCRSPNLADPNKLRDVLLGHLDKLAARLRASTAFARRPGLTLGIVSLITPIKQFPALFAILAPLLAQRPSVQLEIFGAGGYAQVRDLRRALAPLGTRARFWGYQGNVGAIYPQLDYLMTGLPEKEALGLNAIEAQACGTPVLAPAAAPFTETVQDGSSGFLYRDPRADGGEHFAGIVDAILAGRPRPDPRVAARAHLAQFSSAALTERARRLLAALSDLE